MDSDKVGSVFAIGVGHDPSQLSNKVRGPVRIGSEEHSLLVVVVGVQIIPENRRPSQSLGDLLD